MIQGNASFIRNNGLNMELLVNAERRPDLNITNQEPFWDDPHISEQMLKAHLDPEWDAASYKHNTIEQIVEWQVKYLNLNKGKRILDLGCGPGLYTTRFSQYGLEVVGMDYSRNSINYAKHYAETNGLNIRYLYQDYLTMDYNCEFDVIFLIYCDFGALTDCNRDLLLQEIHKALKPKGIFIFDVFTSFNWEQNTNRNWYVSETGFWRPNPHLVLEQIFHYEVENIYLHQHIVMDDTGRVSTYNLRDHYYSRESISQLMQRHGFRIKDIWSDLAGRAYVDNTKCMGIAAQK